MTPIVLVCLGAILLYAGGEVLVRGAAHLAINLGISPLVVGLTVVSFSTSMPEMVSSLIAQLRGELGDLALGNVLGSNIANVGLILGVTAMVYPLKIAKGEIRRETVIMVVGSLLLALLMTYSSAISRAQGIFLFSLLLVYIAYQVLMAKRSKTQFRLDDDGLEPEFIEKEGVSREILLIVSGVLLLLAGGYFLIDGAVSLARIFGIPERVIGLTIVAIGTSLPELATSLVAACRRHHDISIGNIVGSNLFNILCVAGGVAVVKPIEFSARLAQIDVWVMLAFASALLIPAFFFRNIGRTAGAVLLTSYVGYCAFLYGQMA